MKAISTLLLKESKKEDSSESSIHNTLNKHLTNIEIKEVNRPIAGFSVSSEKGVFFIPKKSPTKSPDLVGGIASIQEELNRYSILFPAYEGMGDSFGKISRSMKSESPVAEYERWLVETFTIWKISIYINRFFKQSNALKPYISTIIESTEAHFIGLDHIAASSLLPVFEAGMRKVHNDFLVMTEESYVPKDHHKRDFFVKTLRKMVIYHGEKYFKKYDWNPTCKLNEELSAKFFSSCDEVCDVIYSLSIFINDALYADHKNSLPDQLNRHTKLHLFSVSHNSTDILKVYNALSHICFIEKFILGNDNIPLSRPSPQHDDECLSNYFLALIDKVGSPRRRIVESYGVSY